MKNTITQVYTCIKLTVNTFFFIYVDIKMKEQTIENLMK